MTFDTLEPAQEQEEEQQAVVLNEGQKAAVELYTSVLLDKSKGVFVMEGFSGTGKSWLVKFLIHHTKKLIDTIQLVDPDFPSYDIELTATTNKAAENLRHLTGMPVSTVHSRLGLRVVKDFATRATRLVPARPDNVLHDTILFIDEASWVTGELKKLIWQMTKNCKLIFIGDPDQLLGVGAEDAPIFKGGYTTAKLTEVVRADNEGPITALAAKFRHMVQTGEGPKEFKLDGHHLKHLPRDLFEQAVLQEFNRPDWKFRDSKVLAWTNQRVNDFNAAIRGCVKGSPAFEVNDYVICNSYVSGLKNRPLKTDEMVQITKIQPAECQGVKGNWFEINKVEEFFGPSSLEDWKAAIERLKKNQQYTTLDQMDRTWIDLRAAYACTVDKSQGSTFTKVFIDLDDIGSCRDADRLARMLYVSTGRASDFVVFTGDIK